MLSAGTVWNVSRGYGLEWFGRRSFFDQRERTGQAMWMDFSLACQSGQDLTNHYIITQSLVMAHPSRFFRASVRCLASAYGDMVITQALSDIQPSICDQMREDIASSTEEKFDPAIDQASGTDAPVREITNQHIHSETTSPPVVETPRRSITPNNRSLAVLESGQLVASQCHVPLARGAVSGSSIASLELQGFVEPLPLDQLICHTPVAVQAWPTAAREEVLAVAHRDLAVARRNMADFTKYLDLHAAHPCRLCRCTGRLCSTDVGGKVSPVARWHPVGPARYAEGLTPIYGLYEL